MSKPSNNGLIGFERVLVPKTVLTDAGRLRRILRKRSPSDEPSIRRVDIDGNRHQTGHRIRGYSRTSIVTLNSASGSLGAGEPSSSGGVPGVKSSYS